MGARLTNGTDLRKERLQMASIFIYGMQRAEFDPASYDTIGEAWKAKARELGGDPARNILVSSGGERLDASQAPSDDVIYKVSVAQGDKGRAWRVSDAFFRECAAGPSGALFSDWVD